MSEKVKRLRALRPGRSGHSRRQLTPAEGWEVVMAYRRGVPMVEIAKAIGLNRANIYSMVGAWALRFAGRTGSMGEEPTP